MVAVPGFPPLPISISRFGRDTIDLTIRAAGPATQAIVGLEPRRRGRACAARSARTGRSSGRWATTCVIVTGGIGLAPLRPLLDGIVADRDRFGDVRLFYGARTPADQLYREELRAWAQARRRRGELIVDRADAGVGAGRWAS